jgi:centrin-3
MEGKDLDNTRIIKFQGFRKIVGGKMSQRDPLEEVRKTFVLFDDVDDDGNTGEITLRNLKRVVREL